VTPKFHDEPFEESTLTKLRIFELYAQSWIPVFVASPQPPVSSLHIYDFMAGPGTDAAGNSGTPLRLLAQLRNYRHKPGWSRVAVHLHLFDSKRKNIQLLNQAVAGQDTEGITVHTDVKEFKTAFEEARAVLEDPNEAKLVLVDQFGVSAVTDEVFAQLVAAPKCDFLFFIASQTLHRFHDHSSIQQKISRPDDPNHVHVAVKDYYKSRLPSGSPYFLGRFSLKKETGNIYGIIFGSKHPLGMKKFLEVAWAADEGHGEANFDIDRENAGPLLSLLPTQKIEVFESALTEALLRGRAESERDVLRLCFDHGVLPRHAAPVLQKLKSEGAIACAFRSPQHDQDRPITRAPHLP
jgi:three-Cys-motif partner protein